MRIDKPALVLTATLLLWGCGNSGDSSQDAAHPSPSAADEVLPQQARAGDGGNTDFAAAKNAAKADGSALWW